MLFMDITNIDENFKQESAKDGLYERFNFPNEEFLILGGYYDEEHSENKRKK